MTKVSAGFKEDLSTFLDEFYSNKFVEFSGFITLWKNYKFHYIYYGRPDDDEETLIFINDIFRLTCQFLKNENLFYKVGAIYMLYCLYRTQPVHPPIRIRITPEFLIQFRKVHDYADQNNVITLHRIQDQMLENDFFEYVAMETLMGPLTTIPCKGKQNDADESYTTVLQNYLESIYDSIINFKTNIVDLKSMMLTAGVEMPAELKTNKLTSKCDKALKKILSDVGVGNRTNIIEAKETKIGSPTTTKKSLRKKKMRPDVEKPGCSKDEPRETQESTTSNVHSSEKTSPLLKKKKLTTLKGKKRKNMKKIIAIIPDQTETTDALNNSTANIHEDISDSMPTLDIEKGTLHRKIKKEVPTARGGEDLTISKVSDVKIEGEKL